MSNRFGTAVVCIVMLSAFGLPRSLGSVFSFQQQASPEDIDPNSLFVKNCGSCHGKDGRAKTFKAKFNHARNLTDPNWQASITDEHMYELILKGYRKMPSFAGKLSKTEIGALVTYIRMFNSPKGRRN